MVTGFKTSSLCGDGACVEIRFETSSACSDSACVEVATGPTVLVRQTGEPDNILAFDASAWRGFIAGVDAGEFDLDSES